MQKLFKYLSTSVLISSFTFILIFFLNVLIIRELDPINYGIIILALSIIDIAIVFSSFSLNLSVIRFQEQGKEYYRHLILLSWILFFLSTIFFSFIILIFFKYLSYDKIILKYILIMLPFSALSIPTSVYNAALNRDLYFVKSTFLSSSPVIIGNLIALFLVKNGFDINSLVFRHISSSILFFLFVFNYDFKFFKKLNYNIFKDIFSFNVKLFFNRVSEVTLSKFPIIFISNIFGIKSVSLFERSIFLNDIVNRFLSPIYNQINFSYFGKFKKDTIYLESILLITYYFSIYSSLFIISVYSSFANELIDFLYGSNWIDLSQIIIQLKYYLIGIIIIAPITYLLIALDNVNILTIKNISITFFILIGIYLFKNNFSIFISYFAVLYLLISFILLIFVQAILKLQLLKVLYLPIIFLILDLLFDLISIFGMMRLIINLMFLLIFFFTFHYKKIKNFIKILPINEMLPKIK